MSTQDSGELNKVANRLRGRVWRDLVVAALFAVGVTFSYAEVNSAARVAMGAPAATAQADEANPDGGLLVANRDATDQRIVSAQ